MSELLSIYLMRAMSMGIHAHNTKPERFRKTAQMPQPPPIPRSGQKGLLPDVIAGVSEGAYLCRSLVWQHLLHFYSCRSGSLERFLCLVLVLAVPPAVFFRSLPWGSLDSLPAS